MVVDWGNAEAVRATAARRAHSALAGPHKATVPALSQPAPTARTRPFAARAIR